MKRLLMGILLCLGIMQPTNVSCQTDSLNILYVTHRTNYFTWTLNLFQTIQSELKKEGIQSNFLIESLSFIDENEAINSETVAFLKKRYNNIDLIVARDWSPKINYLLQALPDKPCFISAQIIPTNDDLQKKRENIFIRHVNLDFSKTAEVILNLVPDAKSINVISGNSDFDLALRETAKKQLHDNFMGCKVNYIYDVSSIELLQKTATLRKNEPILFLTFTQDVEGNLFLPSHMLNKINSVALKAPVFGVASTYFNHGIVGGYIHMAERDGEKSARLILKWLKEGLGNRLFTDEDYGIYMFDWQMLYRNNIKSKNLPEGHKLINMPDRFITRHPVLILYLISFIALSVLISLFLIYKYRHRYRKLKELQQNDLRYRILLDNAGVGIGYFSAKGKAILFNNKAAENMGGKPKDFIGLSMYEMFGKELGEIYMNRIKIALNSAEAKDYEDMLELPIGKIWFFSTYKCITDLNGDKIIQIISNNITAIKQQEEQLKKTLEEQKIILDYDPAFIIFKDTKNNILKISNTVAEMTGMPKEDIEGRPSNEIYPDMADKYYADDLEVMNSRKPKRGIIEPLPTADGNIKWLITDKIPYINDKNEVAGIILFSTDITKIKESEQQLKESEERFQMAMKASRDGIWDWDFKTNTVYYSDSWNKILDIKVRDQSINQYFDRIHPDDKQEILDSLEKHKKSLTEYWEKDHRLKTDENKWIWVKGRGKIMKRDENGQAVRMVGTMTDISMVKQAEKELIKAKEKAEESDELKSAFLANMSHEIRTPVNGIVGFTKLLKSKHIDPETQEKYIKIIESSGIRLTNTINDIIDISKIDANQVEINFSECNLKELVQELYDFFAPEAKNKSLNLELKYHIDSNTQILTDKNKLSSIISNLIKNAIKFTTQGRITINCSLENNRLIIAIADTGIGIAENRINEVFKRFIQADIKDVAAHQGSGLGLSITKSYTEMLGGNIKVDSEVGKGSVFTVSLPIELFEDENLKESSTIKTTRINKELNFIIAEDDIFSVEYLKIVLEPYAKSFLVATDGIEVVELLRNNPETDIILMDIKMPYKNGYDAAREIREFNTNVTIIGQSAYALEGDSELAIEAGCDDYITKPINSELLTKLIVKAYNKRKES